MIKRTVRGHAAGAAYRFFPEIGYDRYIFFWAHLGQVIRILPSLTLQICDLPRMGRSRLKKNENKVYRTTYQGLVFVNDGLFGAEE